MISPGTLCYVVGYHGRAGEICTVISGPFYGSVSGRYGERWIATYYMIDKFNNLGEQMAALPSNLIPITPPSRSYDPVREAEVA